MGLRRHVKLDRK